MFARGESKGLKLIACMVLAVFAMFYCGNALFVHTHTENGLSLTHSHPFLPGMHHSHSQSQAQAISLANAALPTALRSEVVSLPGCEVSIIAEFCDAIKTAYCSQTHTAVGLRAPPVMSVIFAS